MSGSYLELHNAFQFKLLNDFRLGLIPHNEYIRISRAFNAMISYLASKDVL